MKLFPKYLSGDILKRYRTEKKLRFSFFLLTGLRPRNISLYKQAMCHSSVAKTNAYGKKESYERLEYLGDAILGMLVAEYLFSNFPFEEEGFLTEMRSKIVNRATLNELAQNIGLKELVQSNQEFRRNSSVYGDCMEALIAAVYLDHGFKSCKKFVFEKLIQAHFDLEKLIESIFNYKSRLLEWSQQENKPIKFEVTENKEQKFIAKLLLHDEVYALGYGSSKKKAEQDAARKTFEQLKLNKKK